MRDEMAVAILVLPRASRDAVLGERQGAIAIRLKAPPVEGAANEALRRLLADRLGVAPSAVRLLRGARSRHKWIAVQGWSAAAVREVLLSQPVVSEGLAPDRPPRG
jgi:uncharacterized protein (TIGR00251 family)